MPILYAELQSHYLFEDRFGRPGKGNDKGKVEGLVGFIRRNFLVPVPRAESFEALNDALAGQCRRRQAARLRGHKETIGERLARDREAFLPLPPAPYDACDKRPGRVSSLSLVRCRGNDYSVPVAYPARGRANPWLRPLRALPGNCASAPLAGTDSPTRHMEDIVMTSHTLPDDPVYAFCPAYDFGNMPQQIRIVFDSMPGYVPTALVALSLKCCAQHLSV